jgi:hypothetical protein
MKNGIGKKSMASKRRKDEESPLLNDCLHEKIENPFSA